MSERKANMWGSGGWQGYICLLPAKNAPERTARRRRFRGSAARAGWSRPWMGALADARVYSSNSQCDRQRGIFALRKTFFRRNTDVFQEKMTRRGVKRPAVQVRWGFQIHPRASGRACAPLPGKAAVNYYAKHTEEKRGGQGKVGKSNKIHKLCIKREYSLDKREYCCIISA